jgi:hypothetical protein
MMYSILLLIYCFNTRKFACTQDVLYNRHVYLPTYWEDVVSLGLEEWKGKIMKAYLCRLVFVSTIYNIWSVWCNEK